jgi:hypothetical protein
METTIIILSLLAFIMFITNIKLVNKNVKLNKESNKSVKLNKESNKSVDPETSKQLQKYKNEYNTYKNKYDTLISKINEFEKNHKKRKGYYVLSYSQWDIVKPSKRTTFKIRIYVTEEERYKNGECRVTLYDEFDFFDIKSVEDHVLNRNQIIKNIKSEFEELFKVSDIEWLELEEDLKEIRKNKIKFLKKSIKEQEEKGENSTDENSTDENERKDKLDHLNDISN